MYEEEKQTIITYERRENICHLAWKSDDYSISSLLIFAALKPAEIKDWNQVF